MKLEASQARIAGYRIGSNQSPAIASITRILQPTSGFNGRFGVIFVEWTSSRRSRYVRFAPIASEVRHRSETSPSAISGHCRHLPNGRLWNVGATMTAYSALMLAARITLSHFSVSSAMSLSKSAGERASAMPPRSARCTFNLRSARPALISLLSFSTTSAGANPRALGWRATGCEHFDRSGRRERPRESGAFQ